MMKRQRPRSRRPPNLRRWLTATLAVSLLAATPSHADPPAKPPTAKLPAAKLPRFWPPIKISRETTRLLGPVDEDGYVDYLAALNQQQQAIKHLDDNAAVVFCQVFKPPVSLGTVERAEKYHREVIRFLGLADMPPGGPFFLSGDDFVKEENVRRAKAGFPPIPESGDGAVPTRGSFDFELEHSNKGPWPAARFPLIAAWLQDNETPLEKFIAGTRRTRFALPLVSDDHPPILLGVYGGMSYDCMKAQQALTRRALLRLGKGQFDSAWNDIHAVTRTNELVAQGPSVMGLIFAVGFDASYRHSLEWWVALRPGRPEIERARRELKPLPPERYLPRKLDGHEACLSLSTVQTLQRRGVLGHPYPDDFPPVSAASLKPVCALRRWVNSGDTPSKVVVREGTRWLCNILIDWDETCRVFNCFVDRTVVIASIADPRDRIKQFAALEKQLAGHVAWLKRPLSWWSVAILPWEARRRALGRIVAYDMEFVHRVDFYMNYPREDDWRTRRELAILALAVAEYRAVGGEYPKSLDDLVPKYIPAVPRDPFTGDAIRYTRTAAGFELRSAGRDGKLDPPPAEKPKPADKKPARDVFPDTDDLTFRVPPTP